jgi:hypothetical protein
MASLALPAKLRPRGRRQLAYTSIDVVAQVACAVAGVAIIFDHHIDAKIRGYTRSGIPQRKTP